MAYYINQSGENYGPYTIDQLRSMWSGGQVTGDTLYCEEGYTEWLRLSALLDAQEQPPPFPSTARVRSRKPLVIAGIASAVLIVICIFAAMLSPSGKPAVTVQQPAHSEQFRVLDISNGWVTFIGQDGKSNHQYAPWVKATTAEQERDALRQDADRYKEKTHPTVHAAITLVGSKVFIMNQDTNDWPTVTIYVSSDPPFGYHYTVGPVPPSREFSIPLTEFAKDSGERFNPSAYKVTKIWIGGGDYDYMEFGF